MEVKKAIYIKLGESGCWEKDSIENNKIRFGWSEIPLVLIKENNWLEIKKAIDEDFKSRHKKNGATNDYNALKLICDVDENTVFITFYCGKMYWCTPNIDDFFEDDKSKYLQTKTAWNSKSIDQNRDFELNQISGRLTKYQLYMGTVCAVRNRLKELEYLNSIINGTESEEYKQLYQARISMTKALEPAIQNLTPKDFEILIDLIFRNSGWKRTSVLGGVMKFFDLVLEEPFSKTLHGVQIKSEVSFKKYTEDVNNFLENYQEDFTSFFYAVHTPDKKLEQHIESQAFIKLLRTPEIADLAIEAGLISWIMDKSK